MEISVGSCWQREAWAQATTVSGARPTRTGFFIFFRSLWVDQKDPPPSWRGWGRGGFTGTPPKSNYINNYFKSTFRNGPCQGGQGVSDLGKKSLDPERHGRRDGSLGPTVLHIQHLSEKMWSNRKECNRLNCAIVGGKRSGRGQQLEKGQRHEKGASVEGFVLALRQWVKTIHCLTSMNQKYAKMSVTQNMSPSIVYIHISVNNFYQNIIP